ncbi:MAG TPA: AMP-binding protein [Ktedonobacteraceae bacterium]|jgi:2-furoate---CoA ligase|nr:AMP-binding protein [Ktedonobacteraceae bacterium]
MNLARYFVQSVERFPDAVAIVDDQVRWTYRDLYREVSAVAASMHALGVRAGDHALVILKNRRENVVVYWACQWLGLIYTPVNFRMPYSELAFCIGDAAPTIIFYEEEKRATLEAAFAQAQHTARVYAVGGGGPDGFDELRRAGAEMPPAASVDNDATAIMLYTSGTTGSPKGVPRSHSNEISAAEAHIIQNQCALFESTIGVMPFYHTMGMRTLLVTTFLNGKLALLPDYDAESALGVLAREALTSLYLVPTLYYDLVNHPRLDQYDLHALTRLGYAGAAMTTTLTRQCFERLHPRLFVNHFGSSEIYTFTICSWLDRKPGCAGRPGFHEAVRIVTADPARKVQPDEIVSPGTPGEVIVSLSSPEAFKGYWHRPEADEKALRQGWYFTGDIGVWDDEGDLWVQGRVDDMLISGGENIHPLEVEDVLSKHPQVREVAVAGLPDERWGQIVAAFIAPADPALSAEELDRFCLASPQLASFKRPRRYIFVKAVPRSPVGKILRRKLQAGEYEPYDPQDQNRSS